MHSRVRYHDKCRREDGETNDIPPQSQDLKAKSAEDGCSGDFDVETIFMVDQGEKSHFIND